MCHQLQVMSYHTDQYSQAYVQMILPTIYRSSGKPSGYCYKRVADKGDPKKTYVRRIPLLALGVKAADVNTIDLGVENVGRGWFPMYWAKNGKVGQSPTSDGQKRDNPSEVPVHSNAKAASILVSAHQVAQAGSVGRLQTRRCVPQDLCSARRQAWGRV